MSNARAEIITAVSAVWRRRWLAIAVTAGICAAGWVAVYQLPDEYAAKTRLYVDTDSLLGPLLRNLAIENNLARQVEVMQRTMLSRPNLQQVIAATDLGLNARTPVDEQNLFERLIRSTTIHAEGPNLFTITYYNPDPKLARDVVRSFIAILMENDAGQNRNDMQKARSFIEKQIDNYEATLKAIEQRIAEFKARHLEELSSSTNGFAARQEAATKAVADRRRDLADTEARRDSLRAQIPRLSPFIEIESAPQVVVNGPIDPLQARILEMQNKLAMMRLSYTEQHPDIIAARRSIDDMMEQQKASRDGGAGANTGKGRISNPVHEQAQMRLLDAEEAVEMARRHLVQALAEEQRTASLAGSAPAIENEFNDLTREYGVQKKQYEELLGRRESARISEAVQNSATRVQFRVIEPPSVPVKPSGPKRVLLTSIVFGLGILGAIGSVIALNRFNDPVISRVSIMQRSALPVLGEISLVRMAGYGFRRRVENLKFGLATTSVILVFAGLMAFQVAKDLGIPLSELPLQLTGAATHAQ